MYEPSEGDGLPHRSEQCSIQCKCDTNKLFRLPLYHCAAVLSSASGAEHENQHNYPENERAHRSPRQNGSPRVSPSAARRRLRPAGGGVHQKHCLFYYVGALALALLSAVFQYKIRLFKVRTARIRYVYYPLLTTFYHVFSSFADTSARF